MRTKSYRRRPLRMTAEERQHLLLLQDFAENETGFEESGPMVEVFKALHWFNSPMCRRKHPKWGPLKDQP